METYMRIMVIHPGFSYSTLAVAEGYYDAFTELGYEVLEYDLRSALSITKKGMACEKIEYEQIEQVTELACGPIINQVIQDNIDIVLAVHGYYLNASIVNSLNQLGVKTALILTDDPMQVDLSTEWSKHYEYVFSNEKNTVKNHKNCHYLPVAVNEKIFYEREVDTKYQSKILIGGSMYRERFDFIESDKRFADLLIKENAFIVGSRKRDFEKDLRLNSLFRENMVSYETMSHYVAGTKISIDIPKDEFRCGMFGESNKTNIRATCLSPRVFECFASKVFCLTSTYRSEIRKLYPGFDIPTWDDHKDICNIIEYEKKVHDNYYLTELKEWTLSKHTYKARVKEIEKIMDIGITKSIKKVFNKSTNQESNSIMLEYMEQYWKENLRELKSIYKDNCLIKLNLNENFNKNDLYIISNGPSKTTPMNCEGVRLFLNDAIKYRTKQPFCTDFAVCIHPNKDVYERCYKDRQISIPLIASTMVYHEVVKEFLKQGESVYFFNTGKESGSKKEAFDLTKFPVLGSGLTVGYSAITIGIFFGFKTIHLKGLDFCYLNNFKYHKQRLKFSDLRQDKVCVVENVRGEPVISSPVMIQSKDKCLNLIRSNPDIRFKVYGDGLLYDKDIPNLENW